MIDGISSYECSCNAGYITNRNDADLCDGMYVWITLALYPGSLSQTALLRGRSTGSSAINMRHALTLHRF